MTAHVKPVGRRESPSSTIMGVADDKLGASNRCLGVHFGGMAVAVSKIWPGVADVTNTRMPFLLLRLLKHGGLLSWRAYRGTYMFSIGR